MGIAPGRLFTVATNTKKAIVDYYTSHSYNLPARRVVEIGIPAADCEQLAVAVAREYPFDGNVGVEATPMQVADAAFQMRAALIQVYVIRCVPGLDSHGVRRVKLPSVDEVEKVSELMLSDPQRIWAALTEAIGSGRLPGCGAVAWQSWEGITPTGEVGGGVLSFLASLE